VEISDIIDALKEIVKTWKPKSPEGQQYEAEIQELISMIGGPDKAAKETIPAGPPAPPNTRPAGTKGARPPEAERPF